MSGAHGLRVRWSSVGALSRKETTTRKCIGYRPEAHLRSTHETEALEAVPLFSYVEWTLVQLLGHVVAGRINMVQPLTVELGKELRKDSDHYPGPAVLVHARIM